MNTVVATVKVNDEQIASVLVAPKSFRTGSTGYYANGKVLIDGANYQMQIQLVKIHSKPNGSPDPDNR